MEQIVNEVYLPLFTKTPRYIILMGGRGAGRSTVASQYALAKLAAKEYFRCAIMRYILGNIRNSIYREIIDRAQENNVFDKLDVNDTSMVLRYGSNSINAVGFKKSSGDQTSKLKSLANYNVVIIEEADEIPEEDFIQLDDTLRTLKADITIVLLLNPPSKSHWIIKRWFNLKPAGVKDFYVPELRKDAKHTIFIHSSYLDNKKNLSQQTIDSYEAYRFSKSNHYWGMIKGLVAEVVRGKIYSKWERVDKIPHEARLVRYWVDWGYTNDPTSIGAIYKYNGAFILDEIAYAKGMSNEAIIATFDNLDKALIIADSSEPKSIDALIAAGLTVVGSQKGSDSIRHGIDIVKLQKMSVTARSEHIWFEYENYAWLENKEGEALNEPRPGNDHAMDGIRYGITSLIEVLSEKVVQQQDNQMAQRENKFRQGAGSNK